MPSLTSPRAVFETSARGGAAVAAVAAVVASATGSSVPRVGGCPAFPRDSAWNVRVDRLPVAKTSADMVNSIGPDRTVHADFGSGTYDGGPIGIPFVSVPSSQKEVRVSFDYADESDKGPYPIRRTCPSRAARARAATAT